MKLLRLTCYTLAHLMCLTALAAVAFAQDDSATAKRPAANVPITVAATGESVRFTALGSIERLRLEVFDAQGQPVFDTAFLAGNVRDWRLTDAKGRRLTDGTYLCVVTAKALSGRLSFKQGAVLIENGQAALALGENDQSDTVTAETALNARRADESPAMTVLAHDGVDGQVTSTSGALTLRTGDVLAGKDTEQMRITPDGSVGIGTDKPEARLDVNGMIRARQGFQFADGSVLNLAPQGTGLRLTLPGGANIPAPFAPNALAGTAHRIPKFAADGSSLLDSNIYQDPNNGFIGIGTTTPAHPFVVRRNGGNLGIHSFGELFVDRDDRNRSASMILGTAGTLKWIFGMPYLDDGFQVFDLQASPAPGLSRFYVHPTNGNVGIGTNSPIYKLDVAGTLRASQSSSTDMVVQTTGGTNAWARMWMITPGQRWTFGTSQNFNGNQLYLFDDTFGQTRMTVQPGGGNITFPLGNIGIGTSSPTARLHVSTTVAQPGVYSESPNRGVWGVSTGGSYGVYGESIQGIGMQGVSTNNIGVVGASTSNIGVYGTSTGASGYGLYGKNLSGMALGVEGNATQNRDKGGLVKAMIYVNDDGTVARCYNSQRFDGGASLPPSGNTGCGFSVGRSYFNDEPFQTHVIFDFQVSDRFWSATQAGYSTENVGVSTSSFSDEIRVRIFLTDERSGTDVFRGFILIVY